MVETKWLRFGKHISELLEKDPDNEEVADIPRYTIPEYKLEVVIGGVPTLGFIDSYDTETQSILEYKTASKPWTPSKVLQHGQLDMYACALDVLHGYRDTRITTLISIPTVCDLLADPQYGVRRAGGYTEIPREITARDREQFIERLQTVAHEISADYKEHINNI
jgi:RecB family exonuclease